MIRQVILAAATVAALSPAISNAASERVSLEACAKAFAAKIAAPAASPGYKLAYRGSVGSALQDFYRTDYQFTLEAHDPKTGATIARASCSIDWRGSVTEVAAIPLDTKEALASRF